MKYVLLTLLTLGTWALLAESASAGPNHPYRYRQHYGQWQYLPGHWHHYNGRAYYHYPSWQYTPQYRYYPNYHSPNYYQPYYLTPGIGIQGQRFGLWLRY